MKHFQLECVRKDTKVSYAEIAMIIIQNQSNLSAVDALKRQET